MEESNLASKLTYKRTTTDKVTVKGVLSADGTEVAYVDDDKNEQTVKIAELLAPFLDRPIDFSVSLKLEEDLDLDAEE